MTKKPLFNHSHTNLATVWCNKYRLNEIMSWIISAPLSSSVSHFNTLPSGCSNTGTEGTPPVNIYSTNRVNAATEHYTWFLPSNLITEQSKKVLVLKAQPHKPFCCIQKFRDYEQVQLLFIICIITYNLLLFIYYNSIQCAMHNRKSMVLWRCMLAISWHTAIERPVVTNSAKLEIPKCPTVLFFIWMQPPECQNNIL